MARLKHQPSSPQGGFRPIQLSRQEISRMQEESNRRIANMERNRQAEMQQNRDVLQTMKEDAAYADQAEQRNFAIQQQNLQANLIQQQLNAKTQQTQADIKQQEIGQIFGGLASFSKTAAQIVAERELAEEKRKEDLDRMQVATGTDDPTKRALFLDAEGGLIGPLDETYKQELRVQEANNGDPNSIARGREANPAQTYIKNTSSANWMLENQYPAVLDSVLNSNLQIKFNDQIFNMSAARSNPRLMQAVGQAVLNEFVEKKKLTLNPRAVRTGLQAAVNYQNNLVRAASQAEIKESYSRQYESTTASIINNPAQFDQLIGPAFTTLRDIPYIGNSGAIDWFQTLITVRNVDDSGYQFPVEQLGRVVLKPGGKSFAEEFPLRWQQMKEARVNDEMKRVQREFAVDEIGYQTDVKRIVTGLTQDPSQGNADAAVEFFRTTYGKVPGEVLKFQASYTTEAIDKVKQAKQLLAIPNGFVTLEAVEAAEALDADTGREIRQRFIEQERRYNSGLYKETVESFKTTANGVTAYGTNKPNTPASVFLQTMMQSEFRKRVDKAVSGGMDFNQAATTIGQQLDQEVKAGARDPNSKWFRKSDAPGEGPSFPNLNKGMLSAQAQAARRYEGLKWTIKTNGLEKVINTKGSILTAEEAEQVTLNYGKPGFTVPQNVLAVAGMSNGLDPMVIINRQLAAQGMQPLAPPPSMATTSQSISPAFKKLLYKSPSINRSIRGLGSANAFNAAIIPNNLGPVIQQASQAAGVNPSYIAALAEIESGFKPDNVSYNGSSFGVMQINRQAHPSFFQGSDWKNPAANIRYGATYYSGLLAKYKDPVHAAMAYNAGPGNFEAYLRGQLPDGPIKTEMLNHGKKFAKVMYKYGDNSSLNNPNLMRTGHNSLKLTSSANSYVGMDTSDGPEAGNTACVWAVNKVMRAAGMNVPWGNSVYVPDVKKVLDKVGRRVSGPVPGAIAIMQDNHPTAPYPHMGIVRSDGTIISNSSTRAKFDWIGTPQEYEQKYGKSNLYYVIN